MMLLNKFGVRMGQRQSGKRGILAVFLVLFVSACASAPTSTARENPFPVGEAEEIFSTGFGNIADKYIDGVSVETLAMEGIRGLAALDPDISVTGNADTLEMRHGRRVVSRIPMPEPDDREGWAFVVASMTAEVQSFSPELASANPELLYEAVFDGAMGALDVFSRYAGKSEAGDNRAKRDGFGGIGVRFRLNGERVVITEVMAMSPAEQADVRVDDELTAIQGQTVQGLGAKSIVEKLRGPVGATVDIVVSRDGVGMLTLGMKRSHIVPPTVKAEVRGGVIYMKISSFNQGTASSVVAELRRALDPGSATHHDVKGVVLDLRGNPGGLLKQSIEVADTFLVHGDILNTSGRHPDSVQHYEAAGQDQAMGLPMVVLIDGKSASAAEIVAAALQDRERAVVIGTASYGKGTVQTVIRLPNSGEITLTWSRFMAPSGYTLHGLGVFPVVCTSGVGKNAAEMLRNAMDRHDKTLGTLEVWRATTYIDKDEFQGLRDQCPPERRTGKNDVEVARTLIENGALYFQALDLTSSTAHMVE